MAAEADATEAIMPSHATRDARALIASVRDRLRDINKIVLPRCRADIESSRKKLKESFRRAW